jgi:hypothetical protein
MKVSKEADIRMTESRGMILRMMGSCMSRTKFGSKEHRTYGELYARMRDIVLLLPSLGKELQLEYARIGCHSAIEMIAQLIETDIYGYVSLYGAIMSAYGCYTEQEGKKGDQFRDQSYTDLYKHLEHEIVEVKKSIGQTVRLHNAMDACCLFAMLAIKIMEEQ